MKVWLSPPYTDEAERTATAEAIDGNWIAPIGPALDKFEGMLSSYVTVPNVVALSSGTAAIHLALLNLGVGSGDEVLVSTFTFAASANPIAYCGGTPVFVESEVESWNMSPIFLREAITDRLKHGKRPKACIVVDLYGMPAKMSELSAVCAEFNIPLIEDAAEALGSFYNGKPCGSFGVCGILSFNGNKIISTGGGGALLSRSSEIIDSARFLATQARDPAPHYQHSKIGYNYRLSNVLAAIGCAQLEKLQWKIGRRREVFNRYRQLLERQPGITFQSEPAGSFSNRWLTTIIFQESLGLTVNDRIRAALAGQKIESRPLWKPLHSQPIFASCPYYGDRFSERIFKKGLCLPSGEALTDQQQQEIASIIEAVILGKTVSEAV